MTHDSCNAPQPSEQPKSRWVISNAFSPSPMQRVIRQWCPKCEQFRGLNHDWKEPCDGTL